MKEQEYLELVNQLKEKFDSVEKYSRKEKEKMIDMKKQICKIYTFICEIDNNISNEFPPCFKYMVERIRSISSELLYPEQNDTLDIEVDFSLIL